MANLTSDTTYHALVIEATSPSTNIWLGDEEGHFVQKATGLLETHLLPGDYTVEFGLGPPCYPVRLTQSCRYTQRELEAGPGCPRPVPNIPKGTGKG